MKKAIFSLCFSFALWNATAAQAQILDREYGDWGVFTINQSGKKICYLASSPIKKKGNYKRRDEPYFLLTHISKRVDEVSTSSGYSYKTGSEVETDVDGKKYKLFTKEELAWAYDTKNDADIVKKMKAGMKMTVRGTSKKGTYSLDTYSLKGITKAYNRMKQLCRS